MRNTALIDAGPLVALFSHHDRNHLHVKESVFVFRRAHGSLVTTWPVISEAAYLLSTCVSYDAHLRFLEWIGEEYLHIHPMTFSHMTRVISLQKQYRDCAMDFADATLVLIGEELSIAQIFTLDKHDFSIYRMAGKKAFLNLLK